jgi:hypothetical protein
MTNVSLFWFILFFSHFQIDNSKSVITGFSQSHDIQVDLANIFLSLKSEIKNTEYRVYFYFCYNTTPTTTNNHQLPFTENSLKDMY